MNTTTYDDGGPAYPISEYGLMGYNGVSIRDYFAVKAVASMLLAEETKEGTYVDIAGWAYEMADAMLEVRKSL